MGARTQTVTCPACAHTFRMFDGRVLQDIQATTCPTCTVRIERIDGRIVSWSYITPSNPPCPACAALIDAALERAKAVRRETA